MLFAMYLDIYARYVKMHSKNYVFRKAKMPTIHYYTNNVMCNIFCVQAIKVLKLDRTNLC